VVIHSGLSTLDKDFVSALAEVLDPAAVGDRVRDLQPLWASVDGPWVHQVDPARSRATVDPVRAMGASAIFSTHLPPVAQPDDRLYETVLLAPQTNPAAGPASVQLERSGHDRRR
jgi:hypothetical protein